MSFWEKNKGMTWFCILAFSGIVGASALVAATPPGEPAPDAEQKTNVRRGTGSSVLFVHSRRRYHRRSSSLFGGSRISPSTPSGRSSTRRESSGNRSFRGGGLFGGK